MPIRVLVVDDSSFYRRQIQKLLSADPNLEVVGTANDGQEAIEKVRSLRPDVVTMDIEMPVMGGIEATRKIMRRNPLPILIFSSLTTEGAQATLDALEAGAIDFIPKRIEDISSHYHEVQKVFCEKITNLERSSSITTPKTLIHKPIIIGAKNIRTETPGRTRRSYKLLAIGTSTGGPLALHCILEKLPKNFPLPIILVQHMPGTFTPAFAARLNETCEIQVKEAENGDRLMPGVAYLAPGGKQMKIKNSSIIITESDPTFTYKPSIDMTFSSLAVAMGDRVLAVILTGMGADGCEGAKELKNAGSTIWAQDKASSVVYGMPAAVYKAGIVEKVLALDDFSANLINTCEHG